MRLKGSRKAPRAPEEHAAKWISEILLTLVVKPELPNASGCSDCQKTFPDPLNSLAPARV